MRRSMIVSLAVAGYAMIGIPASAESRPGNTAIATGPSAFNNSTSATFSFGPPSSDFKTYTCVLDSGAGEACGSAAKTYQNLTVGAHSLHVTGNYGVFNACWFFDGFQCYPGYDYYPVDETWPWTIDRSKPTATLTAPAVTYQLGPTATVAWTSADTGGAGVKEFTLAHKRAPYNAGYGSVAYVTIGGTTSSTHASLAAGATDCFAIRAIDKAGNVGAFSSWRCITLPLDDRALSRSSGWTLASSSSYFNATITRTTTAGALVGKTNAQLRRIGLVATKCPTCGIVAVKVDSATIGTVNLYSSTTKYKQLITLPGFSFRTGTVRVVSTVGGKSVQIDGLALMRD